MSQRNCTVGFVYNQTLFKECLKLNNKKRVPLLLSLIEAYKLGLHMKQLRFVRATEEDLSVFHSHDYIDFLKKVNTTDLEQFEDEHEEYGLGYDCPVLEGMFNFVRDIAGGSLTAAKSLIDGEVMTAINWFGGWHHAARDSASGFCYVNDVVLALERLRAAFGSALYIDLDVHHGDGVENAYTFTNKVMTVSFHCLEPGFFPGTGKVTDIGRGLGRHYTVNVPLKEGIRDEPYVNLFDRIMDKVMLKYQPKCVVVQCGADCIYKDPLGAFSLTAEGLGKCVQKVLSWKIPALFLGGGGYSPQNTAKCWTYLTSVIIGKEIPDDIPDTPYITSFGPDYSLKVTDTILTKDMNTTDYLSELFDIISENLDNVVPCPCVVT